MQGTKAERNKILMEQSEFRILWHESEDVNNKSLLPKYQLIPILRYKLCMIMCIGIVQLCWLLCWIKSRQRDFMQKIAIIS